VPALFTPAWVDELDALARADDSVRAAARQLRLVIQQEVRAEGATEPAFVYHVVLTPSEVAVRLGPADHPTVTFSADRPTAAAIAAGRQRAQEAFLDGRLRVGGDLRALLAAQPVLAQLGDVFAATRTTDVASEPGA
jgi:hypothetical protein